jgi:hypothetical protein
MALLSHLHALHVETDVIRATRALRGPAYAPGLPQVTPLVRDDDVQARGQAEADAA